MNWTAVQRILGLLLMMFSLTMLPPVAISFIFDEQSWLPFVEGFGLTLGAGLIIWLPVNRSRKDLRLRDGFLVVASFWTVLGTFGAAPLFFADSITMSFTDAVFESMRARRIAKSHSLLSTAIAVARRHGNYRLGRCHIADARRRRHAAVSRRNAGPGQRHQTYAAHYRNREGTLVCLPGLYHRLCCKLPGCRHELVVFMFAAGINFSLHFFAWRFVSIKHYSQDTEFRAYAAILLVLSVLVVIGLFRHQVYASPGDTIITGLFQAVSIATTTGFTTANYASWPAALPVALIFASFIGGSAGSTAGGIKVIRCLLIYKQGVREIKRLIHPSAEIPVKLGNKAVPFRVVDAVWGFFSVYIVVFVVLMLAIMATGLDQISAFSAIAATLNNLGPGLGDVASGFMSLTDAGKWIAVAGMLLGRLEIFTLLVLITPTFWRH